MVRGRVLTYVAVSVTVAGVVGCSIALSTSAEQCTNDGDCVARGGAFAGTVCRDRVCVAQPAGDGGTTDAAPDVHVDPTWGCLGNVTVPPAVKPR